MAAEAFESGKERVGGAFAGGVVAQQDVVLRLHRPPVVERSDAREGLLAAFVVDRLPLARDGRAGADPPTVRGRRREADGAHGAEQVAAERSVQLPHVAGGGRAGEREEEDVPVARRGAAAGARRVEAQGPRARGGVVEREFPDLREPRRVDGQRLGPAGDPAPGEARDPRREFVAAVRRQDRVRGVGHGVGEGFEPDVALLGERRGKVRPRLRHGEDVAGAVFPRADGLRGAPELRGVRAVLEPFLVAAGEAPAADFRRFHRFLRRALHSRKRKPGGGQGGFLRKPGCAGGKGGRRRRREERGRGQRGGRRGAGRQAGGHGGEVRLRTSSATNPAARAVARAASRRQAAVPLAATPPRAAAERSFCASPR